MQKSKAQVNHSFLKKMILITLAIATVIVLATFARNYWMNADLEKKQMQAQLIALTRRLDTVHRDIGIAGGNNPNDVQNYTTAQIKDAYLLVRTASTSLQHDQDVEVAKQLMHLAYEHLSNLHGSKIEQARAVIEADQAKLNAVQTTDMRFMLEKFSLLDRLINILPAYKGVGTEQVTTVPQAKADPSGKDPQPWYKSINNVFTDLKSVVKIRKKSDREVTVTDVDVARAQFKLIIEQLRWAAFTNNNDVYQRSITNAQDLLSQIFDMNSESVQKFNATLMELQQIQLNTNVPSVQNSVNALQTLLVR